MDPGEDGGNSLPSTFNFNFRRGEIRIGENYGLNLKWNVALNSTRNVAPKRCTFESGPSLVHLARIRARTGGALTHHILENKKEKENLTIFPICDQTSLNPVFQSLQNFLFIQHYCRVT